MNRHGEVDLRGTMQGRGGFLRKAVSTALVLGALSLGPDSARGQEGGFTFQVGGGAAIPVGDFRSREGWEGKTGAGMSFGMAFSFPLKGPLDLYLGFSQHRFHCSEGVCSGDEDFVATGFDAGLRLLLRREGVSPWLRATLHAPRVEAELVEEGRKVSRTSDGAAGLEVGGGVLIRVAQRLSLSPGIRFGMVDLPFPDRPALEPRYLVADLALVLGF